MGTAPQRARAKVPGPPPRSLVKAGLIRAVIDTRMTGKYFFRMRYELVLYGQGRWRLRGNRKCYWPESRKWCYCQL